MSARGIPLVLLIAVVGACTPDEKPAPTSGRTAGSVAPTPTAAWTGVTPHPRNIQAGAVLPSDSGGNPYVGQRDAVKIGEQLFNRYNCDGCHGDGAAGSVGPTLADGRWRYGGTPREIYQSIYEGRPLGMPSYRAVANEPIWYLVAYLRSLEDSTDHATQNSTAWGVMPAPGRSGAASPPPTPDTRRGTPPKP
jgi:cytochrome c oxidase cbb3-type subunit III